MKARLTAEQKQAKLYSIAEQYTDATIKLASRSELEDWCEGLIPGLKQFRKDILSRDLIKLLKPVRAEMSIKAAESSTALEGVEEAIKGQKFEYNDPAPGTAKNLFTKLRVIAIDSDSKDEMKESVFKLTVAHVASEIKVYKDSTVKGRRTDIIKFLRVAVEEEESKLSKKDIEDTVEFFIRTYNQALYELTMSVHATTEKRLKETSRNLILVDGDKCLEFARKALTDLSDWRDVSIALITATGRRMAEIHHLHTVFTKIDEYHMSFEGQLKTNPKPQKEEEKEEQEASKVYDIPTVIPVDLILAGREYLRQEGKLFEAIPEAKMTVSDVVNKRVSVQISRRVSAIAEKFGIKQYKDLRAVYAEIAFQMHKPSRITKIAYFADILGHTLKDGEGNDSTSRSYTRFEVSVTL
jgi:hypothetical protein